MFGFFSEGLLVPAVNKAIAILGLGVAHVGGDSPPQCIFGVDLLEVES